MRPKTNPEDLKIPAFMRNKVIVKQARQKLLWTAWDRKEAGVKPNSKQVTGRISSTPRSVSRGQMERSPVKRATTRSTPKPNNTFENPLMPEATEPEVAVAPPLIPTEIKPKKLACVGETTHYLDNINVAIIKTTKVLKQGDVLLIEGDECLFIQPIDEMQIDRKPVKRAKKGSHIGLKVSFEAEVNGRVYKLDFK